MTLADIAEIVRGELEKQEKRTASVHAYTVLLCALELGLIEIPAAPFEADLAARE